MAGFAEIKPVARHTGVNVEFLAMVSIPVGIVRLWKFFQMAVRAPFGQMADLAWREVLQGFAAVLFAPVFPMRNILFVAVFAEAVLVAFCAIAVFRFPFRMMLKNPIRRVRLFFIFPEVNNFLRRRSDVRRLSGVAFGMTILADSG